jgi:diacylglycerol diphosphate phosphatase / phosphatidate phosphatase
MSTYGTVEPTMPSPARPDSGLVATRGTFGAVARFWQRTFAPDYVGLVVLIISYSMVCLSICSMSSHSQQLQLTYITQIVTFVEPFHRMFTLNNIDLQYPHAEVERVPVCKTVPIRLELQH